MLSVWEARTNISLKLFRVSTAQKVGTDQSSKRKSQVPVLPLVGLLLVQRISTIPFEDLQTTLPKFYSHIQSFADFFFLLLPLLLLKT